MSVREGRGQQHTSVVILRDEELIDGGAGIEQEKQRSDSV